MKTILCIACYSPMFLVLFVCTFIGMKATMEWLFESRIPKRNRRR